MPVIFILITGRHKTLKIHILFNYLVNSRKKRRNHPMRCESKLCSSRWTIYFHFFNKSIDISIRWLVHTLYEIRSDVCVLKGTVLRCELIDKDSTDNNNVDFLKGKRIVFNLKKISLLALTVCLKQYYY